MKFFKLKRYKGYTLTILSDGIYFDYILKKGQLVIKSPTVYGNLNRLMGEVDLDIKIQTEHKTNSKLKNFIFNIMWIGATNASSN